MNLINNKDIIYVVFEQEIFKHWVEELFNILIFRKWEIWNDLPMRFELCPSRFLFFKNRSCFH